ncbi:hypothetical protein [Streptomyces sp. x-19]|uniref:hypothetical protein n=1 Tax=Streptomyces sp. x-19 TaxID=2789280 RepID=UPI0039816665
MTLMNGATGTAPSDITDSVGQVSDDSKALRGGSNVVDDEVLHDLLLMGGHIIDPKTGRDEAGDVATKDGRIAKVNSRISPQ